MDRMQENFHRYHWCPGDIRIVLSFSGVKPAGFFPAESRVFSGIVQKIYFLCLLRVIRPEAGEDRQVFDLL
jgi:hypothetical protein